MDGSKILRLLSFDLKVHDLGGCLRLTEDWRKTEVFQVCWQVLPHSSTFCLSDKFYTLASKNFQIKKFKPKKNKYSNHTMNWDKIIILFNTLTRLFLRGKNIIVGLKNRVKKLKERLLPNVNPNTKSKASHSTEPFLLCKEQTTAMVGWAAMSNAKLLWHERRRKGHDLLYTAW